MIPRFAVGPILLVLTLLAAAPAAEAAPDQASSRMRDRAGRMEVFVPAAAESVILDSIAVHAIREGYAVVTSDAEDLRIRLEEPATLAEANALGRSFEGTERKRLEFEVVTAKGRPARLRVIGSILLVSNPGATDQVEQNMNKRQPFRNELRRLMDALRDAFRR